jgi:hypothetical protein
MNDGSLFAPTSPRRILLTVICDDDKTVCQACGQHVQPGGRIVIYDTAPVIEHDPDDGGCPPGWTPIVLHGDADAGAQLTLPLTPTLTVIDP